ncbi:MAG: pyroglutamyl-peptidase I [Pirellulales bacterium]
MRILLTAFEPYGEWPDNSSWLALVDFLRTRPSSSELVTRRYPVDLAKLHHCLERDLALGFDAVVHLGQAPGSAAVKLEAFAVNAANSIRESSDQLHDLVESAPAAYRSAMPLDRWCQALRKESVPAQISFHAGTYLCNAALYLSHHWHAQRNKRTPIGFVHLPLASEQVAAANIAVPSLPLVLLSRAVSVIVEDLLTSSIQDANVPGESLV